MRVGDRVTLPSGKVVTLSSLAVKARPWHPMQQGYIWNVVRDHGHSGPSVSFYFDGKRPMQLDESDAKAIAAALNQVA